MSVPETQDGDEVEIQKAGEVAEKKDLDVADDNHDLVSRTGETGTHEIEIGEGAIKRLAEDEYDRDDVGIREPLMNSETACILAEKQEGDSYTPVIEVEYQHNGVLSIRDNGIGITTEVFDKVLRVATYTTNADDSEVSGQMGMGIYATRNITENPDEGEDEDSTGCMITTHSRETDENYKMYMTDRGFDPVPGGMGDDEYGTRIEIPIKKGFSDSDVRHAVSRYSEFLDVPVIYTEYDKDGNEVYDEEYGNKNLEDQYGDDDFVAIYEDEYVKVVSTSSSNEKTTLCNAIIGRNDPGGKSYRSAGVHKRKAKEPWDLKIKHEDGREWEDGVYLPEPTSDRDRLSTNGNEDFFEKASKKVRQAYYDELSDAFEEFNSTEDIAEFAGERPQLFEIVAKSVNNMTSNYNPDADSLKGKIKRRIGVQLDLEVVEALILLQDDMDYGKRGRSPNRKSSRGERKRWKVMAGVGEDADVYMGKSINESKAKVAWELHEDNEVVRIESSYEEMEDAFGWKKLKNISPEEHRDSLSDDLKSKIDASSNSGKPAAERKVVIRTSNTQTIKLTAKEIAQKLREGGVTFKFGPTVSKIVMFPPDTDENITRWDGFFGDSAVDVGAMSVGTKMVQDYLNEHTSNDSIMHIDQLVTNASEVEVTTTEGDVEIGEEKDRLLLHLIEDDDLLERFREDDVMEEMQTFVNEEDQISLRSIDDDDTDILYAPVSHDASVQLQAGLKEMNVSVFAPNIKTYKFASTEELKSYGDGFFVKTNDEMYVVARLNKWDSDGDEMSNLRIAARKSDYSIIPLVDMMSKYHDNGVEPVTEGAGRVDLTINGKQASLGETKAPNPQVADD